MSLVFLFIQLKLKKNKLLIILLTNLLYETRQKWHHGSNRLWHPWGHYKNYRMRQERCTTRPRSSTPRATQPIGKILSNLSMYHRSFDKIKSMPWSRNLGPVYTIPFSFHIGLVSYRIRLLFTRYRFHSISDWPPVYTRTHQSDMLHTVFAFSNENALKVAWNQSDIV